MIKAAKRAPKIDVGFDGVNVRNRTMYRALVIAGAAARIIVPTHPRVRSSFEMNTLTRDMRIRPTNNPRTAPKPLVSSLIAAGPPEADPTRLNPLIDATLAI